MGRAARIAIIIVVLTALPALAVLYMYLSAPPPDDLDLSRQKQSQNGLYLVTIEPELDPVQQGPLHAWIATVADAGGEPVEEAVIAVDGGMPRHGHGLPTSPQATRHLGAGRYLIEGVRFNMGGWWEFRLDISSAEGDDTVVFNIVL
jgi:hypothetical protein